MKYTYLFICTVIYLHTSAEDLISSAYSTHGVSCVGGHDGAIHSYATGGTPPYHWLWNTGDTTADLANLSVGTYHAIVTDAAGDSVFTGWQFPLPDTIKIAGLVTDASSGIANDGSIQITVTGGAPGFTYMWSTGAVNDSITALMPGNYCVTVTDTKACTASICYNVNYNGLQANSYSVHDVSCAGGNDGIIHGYATGGYPPYHWHWDTGDTTADITGLSLPIYYATVTDNNGNMVTTLASFTLPDSIKITASVTGTSAGTGTGGSIQITVTGGTPGYSYWWSNSTGTPVNTNLTAGTYCVTVTDTLACTASGCFTVTEITCVSEPEPVHSFNCYLTGGALFVNAIMKTEAYYTIELADLSGKIIYRSLPVLTSCIQSKLPCGYLPETYYLISIQSDKNRWCKKWLNK